jgi:hypothetical protein
MHPFLSSQQIKYGQFCQYIHGTDNVGPEDLTTCSVLELFLAGPYILAMLYGLVAGVVLRISNWEMMQNDWFGSLSDVEQARMDIRVITGLPFSPV